MALATPSRHSNPFATCWVQPGALPYLPTPTVSPAVVFDRLLAAGGRGQIVGPHGAGKSTLLASIERLARRAGWQWHRVDLREGRDRAARARLRAIPLHHDTLLVIDGFERLGPLERSAIRWRCWRAGSALLVTSHRPIGPATVAEVRPTQSTALAVFGALTTHRATPLTERDCLDAFNACNANIREMLFKLYDSHERHTRAPA